MYELVYPTYPSLFTLKTVAKKMRLANKDVNSKKSTILIQIAWDSGNVAYSWASHFDKVA